MRIRKPAQLVAVGAGLMFLGLLALGLDLLVLTERLDERKSDAAQVAEDYGFTVGENLKVIAILVFDDSVEDVVIYPGTVGAYGSGTVDSRVLSEKFFKMKGLEEPGLWALYDRTARYRGNEEFLLVERTKFVAEFARAVERYEELRQHQTYFRLTAWAATVVGALLIVIGFAVRGRSDRQ